MILKSSAPWKILAVHPYHEHEEPSLSFSAFETFRVNVERFTDATLEKYASHADARLAAMAARELTARSEKRGTEVRAMLAQGAA